MLAIEMGEYYKGGARAQVVQKVEKQLFVTLIVICRVIMAVVAAVIIVADAERTQLRPQSEKPSACKTC